MTKTNENLSIYPKQPTRTRELYFNSCQTQPKWRNIKTKPNLIVSCLLCDIQFPVKYNALKKQYSQKNNWNYWTSQKTDQKKYICNTCLMRLHRGSSMRTWIVNETKADNFYNYVYQGVFEK